MALAVVLAFIFTATIVVSVIQGANVLDSLQAVSVIVASMVAVYGITEWRRAYIGKRKIELAEDVLDLFYRVKVSIEYMRSSLTFRGEGSTREPQEFEEEWQKSSLDLCYVPIERYNKKEKDFTRLNAVRFRFMAVFGKEAEKPFQDLDELIKGLFADCYLLSTLLTQEKTPASVEEAKQRKRENQRLRNRIWRDFSGPGDDPLAPEIKKIIEGIEAVCQPHLS